jgi:hypothetical protein
MIPRLNVGSEDVELCAKLTWVVQTGCGNADSLRAFSSRNSGAALWAEAAFVFAAGHTGCAVIMERAFGQLESAAWYINHRDKSATADALAVAAMAFKHYDRLGAALVSDRAASAASSERDIHVAFVISVLLTGVINSMRFSNSASRAA